MHNVLIVEDHDDLREIVAHNIGRWGYRAIEAENANEALIRLDDFSVDLILLDLMLPGLSGLQFLDLVRKAERTRHIPVIISSIVNQEEEIVAALNAGADDYISKPFSFAYLQAKIASLLRRSGSRIVKVLEHEGVRIKTGTNSVVIGAQTVLLTPKEHKLLSVLLASKGRVFTRENLLQTVWGYDAALNTRTVDAHVSSLRRKLGEKGAMIKSVSKIGYGVGV